MTDRQVALCLGAVFGAAVLLFRGWPGIDLAVSGLFHDPAGAAWAGSAPAVQALRDLFWMATEVAVAVFAVLFVLSLLRRGRAAVPARVWGFAFSAMALGPGLLVNGILKQHWHRPRPRAVVEFGGDMTFTPAWTMAGDCLGNCSFVSGETAGAITLALVLWLIAARRAAGGLRLALGALLGLAALAAGGLRVAGGGHFLSDVVFAWLLCGALTLALWRLTGADRASAGLTWAALGEDLAAPWRGLRRRLRGRGGHRP